MKKIEDFTKEEMEDLFGDGTFSLKERIRVSVMTQEDKQWPTFDGKELDRTEYVTASEASKCARQLVYEKQAHKDTTQREDFWETMDDLEFKAHLLNMGNDDKRGIFERGNWIEDWAVHHLRAMEQEGEQFLCLGSDQRSFYSDHRKVSGTPDGIFVNYNSMTYRVIEFKSTQNPIVAPRDSHVTQVSVNAGLIEMLAQGGLLDEPFDTPFSSMECEGTNLLYIGTDNWLNLDEFKSGKHYDHDHIAFQEACSKARKVYAKNKEGRIVLRKPENVEPEGLATRNGCFFCAHKAKCFQVEQVKNDAAAVEKLQRVIQTEEGRSKKVAPKMPTFSADMPQAKVASILLEYDAARFEEKEADKTKKAIKDAIKPWLEAQKDRTAAFTEHGFTFKVSLTATERKGGYDMKAIESELEKHGLSLSAFQKEGSVSDTFNVRVKEDNEA